MKKRKPCTLDTCILCQQCLPHWLPAIKASRTNIALKKGDLLFKEGEAVSKMYFITAGLVKVHKEWGTDKQLILRIAGSGDIVGHRGLGSDPIYPVSGTALLPTDLCVVPIDFFEATLRANPDLLYQMMMFFAAELKDSENRMRNLAHMSAKGKTANAILSLQRKFGLAADNSLMIKLSRQDFAAYTGNTYETTTRMLTELADENIITVNGKSITIIRPQQLIELTLSR
jgi:CRP-like cAMP-binding protein